MTAVAERLNKSTTATYLGVSERTLDLWVPRIAGREAGQLGGRVYWLREDCDRWIEAQIFYVTRRRAVSRPPRKRFKEVPKYKMIYESGAEKLARNTGIELCQRLFWLAMWFAKPNGHANFQPGAIPELLEADEQIGAESPNQGHRYRVAPADE